MPARRTIIVAACAVTVAGAALTGCDDKDSASGPLAVTATARQAATDAATTPAKDQPFADLSAEQLFDKAWRDNRAATSMAYEISGTDSGSTVHVKAAVSAKGACVATADMDGGGFRLIVPGGPATYLKGDRSFWTENADADAARLFAGKWVKIPKSEYGTDGLTSMCSIKGLVDSFTEDDSGDSGSQGDDGGTLKRKAATTTLDGKQVIELVGTDSEGTADFYVSTGATPYVVKFVDHSEDSPGVVTFSDFGKQVKATAPPGAETVDPKDFGPGSLDL